MPIDKNNFNPKDFSGSYSQKDVTGIIGVIILHVPVSELTAPLAGALWMLLPVGWAAPAFEYVLSHTAEGLNALARVTADLPCAAAEYALGGGATAAVYLFFALATVAAWSAEPKKSVHLPA